MFVDFRHWIKAKAFQSWVQAAWNYWEAGYGRILTTGAFGCGQLIDMVWFLLLALNIVLLFLCSPASIIDTFVIYIPGCGRPTWTGAPYGQSWVRWGVTQKSLLHHASGGCSEGDRLSLEGLNNIWVLCVKVNVQVRNYDLNKGTSHTRDFWTETSNLRQHCICTGNSDAYQT